MARKRSRSEEIVARVLAALEANAIEPIKDYFDRERRENLMAQGVIVEVSEDVVPRMSPDEKLQYWRDKQFQRMEQERTDRKVFVDEHGEPIRDSGDLDETGDPEQDAWLKGDWWVRKEVRVI